MSYSCTHCGLSIEGCKLNGCGGDPEEQELIDEAFCLIQAFSGEEEEE